MSNPSHPRPMWQPDNLDDSATIQRSIRRHLLLSAAAVVCLVVGLGGLAATTELSGAVIAPGQLVVDSNVKKIQHPTGGIVGEILVTDSDHVKAGAVVARLDDTVTRANQTIVINSLNQLYARRARLDAEIEGTASMSVPAELVEGLNSDGVSRLYLAEQSLFSIRRLARDGQRSQLTQRVAQIEEEIKGQGNQLDAKNKEISLIGKEVTGVRALWEKRLVSIERMTQLERDAARLEGERGSLMASIAQAHGKISEIELQILQIDQDLRTEVGKELREVQDKIDELVQRRVTADDQLRHIDILAPQDGVVHQLSIHTVGGVISPGETLMLIVPEGDKLVVDAKIAPSDVDQVRSGQQAILRLTAFNQRTTPEARGEVQYVSPDLVTDPRLGTNYYQARIRIDANSVDSVKLQAGMPIEAFVQTGARSVLSYLTKPLADQIMRAFRDS